MKNIFKNTAVLLIISVVAFVALAFVYELTKEPIALAEQKAKVEAYQTVYAEAKSFEAVDGSAATLTAFNAEYYYYTGAWYYFLYFLDVETENGTNILEALGETLTKAYEAADDRAKEFIRYPYEMYQDWEKVLN